MLNNLLKEQKKHEYSVENVKIYTRANYIEYNKVNRNLHRM